MSRPHNRRKKSRKGPQLNDRERLWKRLSAAIQTDHNLWNESWDAQSIASLLIAKENLAERFAKEPKAERGFRSQLDQTLASVRKEQQYFTNDEARRIKLRSFEEIAQIKATITSWQTFFECYTKSHDLFQGPPELLNDDDRERYSIVESSWYAILSG